MSAKHPYKELLQVEVGSIQRYIFEGRRLREIRGASALLDAANRLDVPRIISQNVGDVADVLRSTGSVTILGIRPEAAESQLESLAHAIRKLYHETVPGAVCHMARVNCSDQPLQASLRALSYAVASGEGQAPATDPDVALMEPIVRFCDSCGYRPPVRVMVVGGDGELLCNVCHTKAQYGIRVRGFEAKGSMIQRFAQFAEGRPGWDDVDLASVMPDDLSDVAGDEQVALILTDGNRLGQSLRLLETVEQYREFSAGVARVVEQATFEALAAHPPQATNGSAVLPWEILFLGGDDVLIATRSTIALAVAQALMEGVEKHSADLFRALGLDGGEESAGRDFLSMATGVAVGPSSYPFRALHDLAGQLERTAKTRAYTAWEQEGKEASTIDFHRITASGRTQIERVRSTEQRPRRTGGQERIQLTQRPFVRSEMDEVMAVARYWKQHVPNTKVHYLRDRLFVSPAETARGWAHVVGRARPDERKALLDLHTLEEPEGASPPAPAPWHERSQTVTTWSTYLLDIIETHELLPG